MLKLYHYRTSVCSEKVRMVLFEKQLKWDSVEVDLFTGGQFDPDYLKLNPKAVVPTLVTDGQALTESTLIAEYLDDAYPTPPLRPADPKERLEMRLYTKACDEGLHQGVAVFSYSTMFRDRLLRLDDAARAKHMARIVDLDRRDRQIAVLANATDAPHVYRGVAAYEKIFKKIDKTLADGRHWLTGDMFSLAEIALSTYVARLDYMNILDVWIGDRPRVQDWFKRIKARPCYKAEVMDWTNDAEIKEMYEAGSKAKDKLAEKRKHYLANDFGAAYA